MLLRILVCPGNAARVVWTDYIVSKFFNTTKLDCYYGNKIEVVDLA